ncbi:alpha/beta hydrolase [Actinocorallia sp. API 0066]|uniref:esterase/lipase family protein n=1 Tax=Actinocorallia sp. API 0066 TaxID=2896846 RepID=UPI001E5A5791|nr:alpha/beta hydrolase [Actinocorallia sp. API 0066]MCD0452059.1 alpha/beta hydrolase [Actinocorallia sp. API 0066]
MTKNEITDAFRAAPPIALAPSVGRPAQAPPVPDAVWNLPGGTAWVYHGAHNPGLVRPVVLADGFNTGPSTLEFLWQGLEWLDYPLLTELHRRGRDVILLGFTDRAASIPDNARAAQAAILRVLAERIGDHRLTVGGFSMGGLVTRYTLARFEAQRMDHQTALYWSWDTPHRGAYVPVSLQAFAHYLKPYDSRLSDQLNSPAARQMLAWHLPDWNGVPAPAPERAAFLTALEKVGGWPRIPRVIGLADGTGDGTGNGADAGLTALVGTGQRITGTDLRTQPSPPDTLAGKLRLLSDDVVEAQAPGVPPVDGAPGGTLAGFGILADALNQLAGLGLGVDDPVPAHCFVPSASAVSIRDITAANLYVAVNDLDPGESDFDDYVLAPRNNPHTRVTRGHAEWLLDRLPH